MHRSAARRGDRLSAPRTLLSSRARTFDFAARFLPPEQRRAVTSLYAFCRYVDDLVDERAPWIDEGWVRDRLDEWRGWLRGAGSGSPPDPAPGESLVPLLARYPALVAPLLDLIDGVASDLDRQEITTWSELRTYCYRVASSVGLCVCVILGAGDDPEARQAAIDLGIAMQLTNILRDLGADLRKGYVYLPRDEIAEHGLDGAYLRDIAAACIGGRFSVPAAVRTCLEGQIERARDYYARGLLGVGRLHPRYRFPILLAGRLYGAILDDVRRAEYDVFTRRAHTTSREKLVTAAATWFELRRSVARSRRPVQSPLTSESPPA